jgi:hypothetical protein
MLLQENRQFTISIPGALKLIGMAAGATGIIVVLAASLAYLPAHPNFTIFNTYLSEIGDTPGWPQILFNSGTLIAAPLRYLALVLVAMALQQMGAGRSFVKLVMMIGFVSTFGTVLMTAVPFSVAPSVHKSGIGLYFFGIVILQSIIYVKERKMKDIPRILPGLSISVVAIFLVFFVLMILYETGMVGRNIPVIWEWMCFASSIAWVFAHSLILGKDGYQPPISQ